MSMLGLTQRTSHCPAFHSSYRQLRLAFSIASVGSGPSSLFRLFLLSLLSIVTFAINAMLVGVRDSHLFVFLHSSASSINTSILLTKILQLRS